MPLTPEQIKERYLEDENPNLKRLQFQIPPAPDVETGEKIFERIFNEVEDPFDYRDPKYAELHQNFIDRMRKYLENANILEVGACGGEHWRYLNYNVGQLHVTELEPKGVQMCQEAIDSCEDFLGAGWAYQSNMATADFVAEVTERGMPYCDVLITCNSLYYLNAQMRKDFYVAVQKLRPTRIMAGFEDSAIKNGDRKYMTGFPGTFFHDVKYELECWEHDIKGSTPYPFPYGYAIWKRVDEETESES